MEKFKAWQTPLTIIGIIVVFGLLTATWSGVSSALFSGGSDSVSVSEPLEMSEVTIDVDGTFYTIANEYLFNVDAIRNIDDQSVSGFVVLGVLTGVIFGGVFGIGLVLMGLTRLGDRSVSTLKEDDSYKAAVAEIDKAQKAFVKENKTEKPPRDKRGSEQPMQWSALSTGLVATMLSYFLGAVIGAEIEEGLAGTMGQIFAVVGALISAYLLRPSKMAKVDDSDYEPTPRGTLWIMLSGAIIIGLGLGFTFAVINGEDPFIFLDPTWQQENIWGPLSS